MKRFVLISVLVSLIAGPAIAQTQKAKPSIRGVSRNQQTFTIARDGIFVLENAVGNIEVTGADVTAVEASIVTIFVAADQAAMDDARKNANVIVGGDERTRRVRTVITNPQRKQWTVTTHWTVRVPRTAGVRLASDWSDKVRVSNVQGNVFVKTFKGSVGLENVTAATFAESVNGSIVYSTPNPRGNVVLSTINGHVTASVAADADFRWVADTAMGDIRTNLPPRGAFIGRAFRGTVNAPGGPSITTNSVMGDITLLAIGAASTPTVSLRKSPALFANTGVTPMTSAATGPRVLRRGTINGPFNYATQMGDVRVQQVRGSADVFTGAGAVQIGAVSGTATVKSHGGPLEIGEVLGALNASTRAGDILVDSTRRGGTIQTQGGTIRLLYTSGPTRLVSGGGDIIVRQAAAPIHAETTSGDIAITMDSLSRSEKLDARTGKGNIVLTVGPAFRGDIDATIVTADPNAHTVLADIPGLTVRREQEGGRTRIRATGKINGGGQKITLQATEGDIRISTGRAGPTVVKPQ